MKKKKKGMGCGCLAVLVLVIIGIGIMATWDEKPSVRDKALSSLPQLRFDQ